MAPKSSSSLLSADTLDLIPGAARPLVRPESLRTRIAHFGLGAFHRAHQALYTEIANFESGADWGVAGLVPNSRESLAEFRAQDCLYSLTEKSAAGSRTQVIGTIRSAQHLIDDAAAVQNLLASQQTEIVTLTVTEKGYQRLAGSGGLDTNSETIAADLAATGSKDGLPKTVIGHLAHGLARRFHTNQAPLTVISCDNISGNGDGLARVVLDFIQHSHWADRDQLLDWIQNAVRFPNTLVDRIVPVPTQADRQAAAAALGLRDELAVATEAFRQWVIQDSFSTARPRWELAGAQFTSDVKPFELTKLRLLNGSHSALAYLGLSAGVPTVAAAMRTEWGPKLVQRISDEAAPTLPAGGPDRAEYTDDLIERFANPAMADQLKRIGCDGSQKIPERWLGALRGLRAQNLPFDVYALGLAGWANATNGPVTGTEQRFETKDPKAAELAACWLPGNSDAQSVAALLRTIGAEDLAEDRDLLSAVADRLPGVRAGRIEIG
jgi:fructuronate reductase